MHTTVVLLALVGSVFCDVPYPARVEKPHLEYGIPHEVYGVPEFRVEPVKLIKTEYNYDTFTPKKIDLAPYPARVEVPHLEYNVPQVIAPYPASIEKPHDVYGVPKLRVEPVKPIKTEYNYEIFNPKKIELAPYPARVEVPHLEYNVPQVVAPYPARIEKPHDVYGVPKLRVEPVKPIKTEYNYEIFNPKKIELAPYPARVEVPHLAYNVPQVVAPYPARIEKPHDVYGVPKLRVEPVKPIKTEYNYEIFNPKKIELAPYPARVEVPHLDYNVPQVVAPYPARIEKPHDVYGVPKLRVEPVKPIKTEYKYEIFNPKKIELAPYPARVEVPHLEYNVPQVIAPYPARIEKPHDVYVVPKLRVEPVKPIKTEYKYETFTPKKVEFTPYPAHVEVPHLENGVPQFLAPVPQVPKLRVEPFKPIKTEYNYETFTPKKVKLAPYPAHIEIPHIEYGVPAIVAPYPARTKRPLDVYGFPELRVELVKPIKSEYHYETFTPKKVKLAPYTARVEVPHLEYGVPLVPTGPYPARI